VTREAFIVFSGNALALVGLRSLYFVLMGRVIRFVYLDAMRTCFRVGRITGGGFGQRR
jgi:predicted tellurium resistance membrane protein TerC